MNGILRIDQPDAQTVRLTLNRPERNNAFDEYLIAALHQAFAAFAVDSKLATVILMGAGKNFCAEAPLASLGNPWAVFVSVESLGIENSVIDQTGGRCC